MRERWSAEDRPRRPGRSRGSAHETSLCSPRRRLPTTPSRATSRMKQRANADPLHANQDHHPEAGRARGRRQIRCVLRVVRVGAAAVVQGGRDRFDGRCGHLPRLRAGRTLHLAAQDPAHQFLRLRLRLLRQPVLIQRGTRAVLGRRGREADAGLLQAQLHRGPVPVVGYHPQPRLHDGGDREGGAVAQGGPRLPWLHPPQGDPWRGAGADRGGGRYADRLSVNVELPTDESVVRLAPEKKPVDIRRAMGGLKTRIEEAKAETPKGMPRPSARSGCSRRRASRPR